MKVHKRAKETEEDIYDSDGSIEIESNGSVSEDEDEEESDESSTEEVFGINASSDEDEDKENEESASDFDVNENAENKEDGNIIGSKSWGKRKKYFYQTDTATKNSTFRNEEEEEAAKMEELEAMTIQKRLTAEIDNVNLLQDLFPDIIKYDQKEQVKNKEVIEIDLLGMNENEKHNLLNKEYPELFVYINDFKKYMVRIKNKLHPLLSAKNSKKKFKGKRSDFWEILHTMYEICMTYCTNIAFYILYRLRRSNLNLHPVLEKLSEYKMLIKKLDSVYTLTIEPIIDSVLSGDINIYKIPETNLCSEASSGVTYAPINEFNDRIGSSQKYPEHVDDTESAQNSEEDINSTMEDGKRKITYEMAKNKGLTPRRKKEYRNPRVKLRNKYRKAKIRRKGQIREPRKELKRYSGEVSGINPHVSRSVSLKF